MKTLDEDEEGEDSPSEDDLVVLRRHLPPQTIGVELACGRRVSSPGTAVSKALDRAATLGDRSSLVKAYSFARCDAGFVPWLATAWLATALDEAVDSSCIDWGLAAAAFHTTAVAAQHHQQT